MFKNAVNIEVTVFSRGVPTNQFQVVMYLQVVLTFVLSCLVVCFQVVIYKLLQVGTRCHLFTSCYTLLQVVTMYFKFMYQHVRKWRSRTFGNDVEHRNCTAKSGSKM